MFNVILIDIYQQQYFNAVYLFVTLLFVFGCQSIIYTIEKNRQHEKFQALSFYTSKSNDLLTTQTLSSKLFIHDQINLINQINTTLLDHDKNKELESLKSNLLEMKSNLIDIDDNLNQLSKINPLLLQHFIATKIVYCQQLAIQTLLEIEKEISFKGNLWLLIEQVDNIIDTCISIANQNEKKEISISILQEDSYTVIIIAVSNKLVSNEKIRQLEQMNQVFNISSWEPAAKEIAINREKNDFQVQWTIHYFTKEK